MNDNENLKSLYNTLQKEGYTPPVFEQFAKDMEDDGNLRGVYSTLQNEGYTPPDYDTFRSDMGFGKVAKTNPKVKVGSHAQMVVDEYDRAAKAAGAELTGNNEKLNGEARNEANKPNRTDKTNEPDTPRMQFVPEAENVIMATPTAETLKKYPWLKADEAVPFDRNTGEPLHTWVDEQGNPISQRNLDVRRAKEDITGEKEYMQKTPASLQLPGGTTRGVRPDGSISGYVDNMMKQQYGDDYLNGQYTTKDGRQVSGADYLNEKAQETYDQLNKEMDEARMSYIDADEEKRKELVDALANKYVGLLTRDTIQRAMDDEQAQEEAKATKREHERAQLDAAYDTAYARRAEAMNENMRKAQEEYENSSWLDRMFGGNPVQRAYWANQNDRRIQIADTQMNIVLDARKIIDAGEAYDKGETWAGRLVRGMGDALTDTGLYDSGVEDMHDLRNVKNALDAYEAGTATKEQKELLDVYALLHTAQGENADAMGGWYGAGGTTVQALPFMAQMAINPASNLGSATMKAATKWGVKQFGKTAMNKYLKRMFVTSLKAGGRVTGDALAAVLPAFTFGSPAITADTYDRLIGNVNGTEDEAGNIIYKNRSDFETSKGAAIAKAAGANLLEYQSEMAGPYFGALSKIAKTGTLKGLEKIGLEKTRDFLTRFSNKDFYRAYASFARKTQWHGTFEEYLEEVYNNVANAIFIGDMDFSTGDNGVFNLEMNLDTLLGVAVMSGAMSTLKTVDYARTRGRIKDELDEAYKSGLDIFGTDEWERITDRIDGLDDDKAASEIRKIISDVDGKERKHAVVNYAAASFMNQGLNMGELKNSLEQISDAAVNGGVPKDAIPGIENLTPEERQNMHDDGMIHAAVLYPTAENNGQPQEVFITRGNVALREDGTIDTEASDKEIYYKGADGQVHLTSPDKFQSVAQPISVEEYAAANAPQESQTEYMPGQQVNVNIDGQDLEGEVTNVGEDGSVLVSFENPDGTLSSRWFAPEELQQPNGGIANGQEEIQNEQPPITGENVQPTTVNNVQQEQQASQPQQIEPSGQEQTALSRMPVDEKGKPAYDKAEPDLAWDAIMEKTDGDEEMAKNVVDAMVKQQETEVDKLKKKQPKATPGDVDSMIAAQKEKKAAIAAAEERLEQWRKIADTPNRRAAAAKVQPTQNPSDETLTRPGTAIAPTENTGNVEPTTTGNGQTTEQGGEVPAGVQGTVEDGAIPERTSEDRQEGGSVPVRTEEVESATEGLTNEDADNLLSAMEARAEAAPDIELTPTNWVEQFGEDGMVETPIGKVKMGENQIAKLFSKGRSSQFGMIRPTLTEPDVVVEVPSSLTEETNNDVERPTSLLFIKVFLKNDGSKVYYFKSVTVKKDGLEVSVSSHLDRKKRVEDALIKGKLLYRFDGGAQTEHRPADVSVTTPLAGQGASSKGNATIGDQSVSDMENGTLVSPQLASSESKDTQTSANEQTVGEKIAQEEAKVEQNPTEAQKEAGNYKKGHVKIDGYDVTIENPKGSVRKGTDRNGQEWSVTMNNTYGYIRGTEGVDGDHIDVFLSDDPTQGDVYVIDQVNENGSFDEHKVMYGFNSVEEARDAYLANYSPGWQGLGTITEVSKEEFKKWINSSHRKIKPFAEYKSVNKEEAQNEPNVPRPIEGEIRFREADNEISDFARKHNLNEKDVQDYADYMRRGNLNGAARAFHEIRRKVMIDNEGTSFGEFVKLFSPVKKELYEKFGNIDDLREQYVQAEMEERNMMEAARKRAEEAAEAERRRLQEFQDMSDEQLDEEYSKAVEANDESRMRDLVNEAARRNGYGDVGSEYQGVGAWSAPSNPGYESDEERRAAVENDAPDVNITDIANGYSQQPSDYFTNLRAYGTDTAHGRESAEAINKAIDEVRNGKDPMVKVYRAVPKSVKEGKLRNGDWVTPSRKYAEMHGDNRLEGDYRIIEQEVPASQLWWDGNDINEWGFDDGKGYAYRNTKNNRKLNDLITRDDKGNIIPLSQRFNARKADVRYRNTENQAATDNIEDVNKQFNQQLEGLTEENADKVTLSLGRPSAVLRAAGVEDKPMKLYGNKVIKKMRKHGFTLAEIKDLPRAVADPIAVFNNYQKNGNRSILTELQIGDKHILVSVTVGKTGVDADFNIVSSVFGKGSNNVVDWINKGYATFINKEKALDYLHFSERSISEASDNQELVSTANIIRNFENPNVLEENLVPTEQTNDIDAAVADTANKLNIGVRVAHSVDEVSDEGVRRAIEKGRNVKGWYDTRTGEIVVYAPNATDADDAVRTVLHEGVAHYGLRQLVGDENFDTFLDNIYNNVDGEIKAAIDEKAQRNGWSTRVATEEYLASLAEDTNFEAARSSGLWQRIKDFFMDLLTKAGVRLNEALTDNELRYMLWRSYENLAEPNGRGTIGTVRDVAMQGRLGVGNYGNEDMRLRETEDEQTPEKKSENKYRELYDRRVSRKRARLNRSYFDSMQPVKVLQQTITEETGQQIRPEENVYLQENRANSMAQRKHEMWERGHMEPARREVTKLMQQIMGGNWLTRRFKLPKTRRNAYNAVVRYMKSKHGLENNEYRRNMEAEAAREPFEAEIGAVEKLVKDGNISRAEADKRQAELKEQADKAETESRAKTLNKDYSGLQGIYGKDFERKAKEYVEDFEGAYDTAPLWREWNGATKAILEEEYKSGLLSKELYDRIRKMYKYYIPLKGWAENRAEDVYTYYATGSGDGGKPHRREGRTSESDDPLVTLEQDADRQFTAAARNRTKQALYNLATAHKSSLLTVRRQWYQNIGTKENPDWQRKDPEIPENATPEQMEQIIKDFEKDMRKLEKEGTAMRQKKPMILPYHATKSMEKEHTVRVMVNGKEYVIYVNGNPAAAQAVNGTSTPQDPDGSVLKRIYGALRWINRAKASLLTAVNLNFIPSNLVRDAQYSIQNMKAKEPVGYVLKYVKNLGEGIVKMTSARLFYKDKKGTLNMDDKTERLFKEFLDNGGETGYTARYTLEKQRRRNMAAINRMTGIDWLAGLRMLQHSLEYVNRSVETIVRFAAYKTSREAGRNIAQSINDAKEASVNFDKHGSGELGNKEWRLAYIFSNVGFQALRRLMENASGHPVRFTLAQIERFALGFAVPMMAKAMLDAYGDDDEKDAYEALPEWMRESGLAVPVSPILRKVGADDVADKVKRVFLYLPLGPEDKIWYALGENAWHLFNKGEMTVEDEKNMALKFGSLAADLLPLDFQGYGGNPIVSLAPTIVQDFVALEQNVNYWGQPIYRESTNYNEHDPGHRLAFTGTPEWYVERAEDINRLTGGDEYTKGWLSPKPEQIEYFINQTGGGVTRVVNQVMSLIERAGEDGNKDIQVLKNVPVVSSLVKKADVQDGKDGFDREKYYDYIDEYEKALHDYNAYRKAKRNGDDEAGQKAEKLKESPTGERMDIIRKDIRKIRNKDKQVRRIDEKENPTAEEEARRNKLKTESNELKQKLLEKLDKVKEKPGKQ